MMVSAAFVGSVLIPLQAAFLPASPVLLVASYLLDAIFLLDFYLKLHTGGFTVALKHTPLVTRIQPMQQCTCKEMLARRR